MDLHIYRNSHDRWHDVKAAAREHGAVLALNALTLHELVQKLTPDLKPAAGGQRLVLMETAIRQSEADGVPGIVRYASEALAEVKAARVRSAELRTAGAELLAGIQDNFDEACRRTGLVDPQERIWVAAGRVKESIVHRANDSVLDRNVGTGLYPWLTRFHRVVLHALYDLNEAEFRLLQSLIERLPEGGTVILFNTTANVKPTRFAEWTWQRFIQDEMLANKTFPEFCRPFHQNRAVLDRLFVFESALEAGNRALLPGDESIRILEAPGRYSEIESIGSQILDILESGGSLADVAVVVRHI
jgi:hypothetical protein